MSEANRLDLSTPQAKRDAAGSLPVLMMGAALGSPQAADMAGQIIGQAFTDALAPSFAALARLQANRTNRSEETR